MKRIFFYANFRSYDETAGITRKVKEQVRSFRKLGYEVYYTGYANDGVVIFDNDNKIIKSKKYKIKNQKINHILRRNMLINISNNFLKETTKHFDICYLRYHFFDYSYLKLLINMKKLGSKVIIEAHTYPVFTSKDRYNPISVLDLYFSRFIYKYCDLIAAMSNLKNILSIPTYEIENSIDISKYKLKQQPKFNNKLILINVAFENITHGLDRVILGLYNYKKKIIKQEKIKVDIFLIGEYSKKTKKLVKDLKLENEVKFLGKKNREEMNIFFDKAHLAIGSLGNHRANSYYGSALKTKEYMSRGIPIIYGWEEKILYNFNYGLKIELCEKPVDFEKIINFYEKIYKKDLSNKIRSYLVGNNITWEKQFEDMIEKLKK